MGRIKKTKAAYLFTLFLATICHQNEALILRRLISLSSSLPPLSCSLSPVFGSISFPPYRGLDQLFAIGPWGLFLDKLDSRLPFSKKRGTDVLYVDLGTSSSGGTNRTPKSVILPSDSLPKRSSNSSIVRIVAVSDTHGKHELLKLPKGDILCHCGDILLRYGYLGNHGAGMKGLENFCRWMQRLRRKKWYQHTVVIGGNHDTLLERRQRFGWHRSPPVDWHRYGITYLEHNSTELLLRKNSERKQQQKQQQQQRSVKIWGSPYSLPTGTPNRAFQSLPPPMTEATLLQNSNESPIKKKNIDAVDIVMTHSGLIGDKISNQISKVAPKLWICGHFHDGYGRPEVLGNGVTTKINCASTDMKYHINNPPVVVDIQC